ncbi:AfsR/SARP family transcriptional regulator [Nocardiopsis halophila]|uniref:AfsR/SARP family transcriptional regulator n=1 Tax=Nocardiopsis halophila TaxID=141692 RepID=UPI00034B82D1|nr:AfsR/SARP family transcriptional regulator [Nocardiopsis halophila]
MAQYEFGVLGPLSLTDGDRPVELRGTKRRALLALLLLRCGRTVPIADIVTALWGTGAAPDARKGSLQVHVARLRAALGEESGARILVTGVDGGYRMELPADRLDLLRLRALRAGADRAEQVGDALRAYEQLRDALALWRGPVLEDVVSAAIHEGDARHLEDELLQAAEHWGALGLRLGRHGALLQAFNRLVPRFPEREELVRQHMVALYRSGRQGDALAAFGRARRALVERFGLDPGHGLQRTFEGILRGDLSEAEAGPAVPRQRTVGTENRGGTDDTGNTGGTGDTTGAAGTQAKAPAGASRRQGAPLPRRPRPVPAQLPAPHPGFVGREAELGRLDRLLGRRDGAARALISGPYGAGCTALALRWAAGVEGFPDGRLYADLKGDEDARPGPGEVAARFLRALGVPEPYPDAPEERAALLRSALAGRRVLMLLDNARSAGQVRPLLPGSPPGVVIVTSRYWLADLIIRDGVQAVEVGALSEEEAVALLAARIGVERAGADPEGVRRLVGAAGRLPLPLSMAAAWLSTHPGAAPAELAARVEDRDEDAPAVRMAAALGGDPRFLIGGRE